MGNSSKKHAKKDGTKEGGRADDQAEPGSSSVTKAVSQLEADRSDVSEARGTDKPKLNGDKKEKEKEKKKKDKKKGKEKAKKNKNKLKTTEDLEASVISNGTNCIDVTNFQGDTQNISEAVTISVCVEPKPSDSMGGKENTRPLTVYEGRSRPRPVSPTGPGVSKLMEKFGGKSGGTPRPISFPAAKTSNASPRSDLHQAVARKPFGFNRLEETPQRRGGDKGLTDGNVNALRLKFGDQNAAASTPTTKPTTPTSASSSKHTSTPTTTKSGGGLGNRLQNERTPVKLKSSLKKGADRTSSSSTITPTSTSGVSALRNKFNKNREDGTQGSDTEQLLSNPENKRKIEEERKRAEEAVQKENAKNRSPRKHWSPKKEPRTPSREESPTKETSPRKRKSGMLQKFGKTKQATKDEHEDDVGRRDDEEEKEKARELILNRTSALIHGTNNTSKATAPSKVQFEETTPKRTRREEKPRQRPKTEYNFKSVPSPRPKSMADNIQVSTPPSFDKTISAGTNIIKNPTTKTQKLLQWCQIHTQGYKGVKVSNFSSSWADGLAFCALVHRFFPTVFDFNALSSSNRRENFDLAFSSAEKHATVPQLLETEDMIIMGDKPDWKCVFTYVTSLYAGLTKHSN